MCLIKKVILILFISFVAISAVSAEEITNETILKENEEVSITEIDDTLISDDVNSGIASNTLEDLSNEINNTPQDETLYLKNDYCSTESSSQIIISKSITIDGQNHVISAPDVERVFLVKSDNVCIKNINFINSKTSSLAGGAISWWGSNGTLENCNFSNNSACSGGGAVLWKGDYGIISNCNFENNSVKYGKSIGITGGEGYDPHGIYVAVVEAEGGALCLQGNNITVDNCNFYSNIADLDGGAISMNWASNISISNSRFKNNKAAYSGGAIDINGQNVKIINSGFEDNSPKDIFNNCQNTVIINSYFKNNNSIDSFYSLSLINSFDDLSRIINDTPEGGNLILYSDYQCINSSNKGIVISKSITIDGNGHTLNGNKLSRMFNITADNVTIKNINFVNGNILGRYFSNDVGGGAIYWSGANGVLFNCSFMNNTGSGLEYDPFEQSQTYVDENGLVWHHFVSRPMGAKINEGGAIVWKGVNGTVDNCLFENNGVGYPNYGGAIIWRGGFGKVIDSKFYNNDAWGGASICWLGSNGLISGSYLSSGSLGACVMWYAENGKIINSTLRDSWRNNPLLVYDGNLTVENVDLGILEINTPEIISEDKNNNFANDEVRKPAVISKVQKSVVDKKITKSKLITKNISKKFRKSAKFNVKVLNSKGKAYPKQLVKIKFKGKIYKLKTNKKGIATFKISKNLKLGKYTIKTFCNGLKKVNRILVRK